MTSIHEAPKRGRIPMHRSIRHVHFYAKRAIWLTLLALVIVLVMAWFIEPLVALYGQMGEGLLRLAHVPFSAGSGDFLGPILIPTWKLETFNPVASTAGLWGYVIVTIVALLLAWLSPRIPLPVAAWIGIVSLMLLLAALVLHGRPVPMLTPETFSGLWGKVTIGTMLIYPAIWAMLVGILPQPIWRVAVWFLAALGFFFVWSIVRLAFFLALAHWAGVVWLPIGIVFGLTLLDCLVLVVAFGFFMEKAGHAWEKPA